LKKTILSTILITLLLLASSQAIVLSEQTQSDGAIRIAYTTDELMLTSRITAHATGTATNILAYVAQHRGTPNKNLNISIRTNAGTYPNEYPSTTTLGTGQITPAQVNPSYILINVSFNTQFPVINGTTYWIIYETEDNSNDTENGYAFGTINSVIEPDIIGVGISNDSINWNIYSVVLQAKFRLEDNTPPPVPFPNGNDEALSQSIIDGLVKLIIGIGSVASLAVIIVIGGVFFGIGQKIFKR